MTEIITGEGWAVGGIDAMGDGPGFRKVRRALEVTEFGVNTIVLPPDMETGVHWHERQQELYFVHRGVIEMELGGEWRRLEEGDFARVDAPTPRRIRNPGDRDAIYVIVGGQGGYVGRDAQIPEGEQRTYSR